MTFTGPILTARNHDRIAIVGPVPPFRGGIAQHTAMMSRALAKLANVLVLSYTRQYPRWLYPGASDIDPAARRMTDPPCRYMLDSLNPGSWRKTVAEIASFRADSVIIPWWSAYWTVCSAYLSRQLAELGIPVHFFCHNVAGHGATAIARMAAKMALGRATGFLVQTRSEMLLLQEWLPSAQVAVVPHPVFSQFPGPSESLPRRAGLELLFFGFVRPYKGLEVLLQALTRLPERDVMLTIAGEFWGGADRIRKLVRTNGLSGKVEIADRYVTEMEAATLFSRADALVMPYCSATGSGVLGLAYRYGKPVIASNVPGLAEQVRDGETGLLVKAGSSEQLALALDRMTASRARAMAPAIVEFARNLTWDALAASVLQHVRSGGH
jgi:glycosyltransferase involved in cell wall biosynthesis